MKSLKKIMEDPGASKSVMQDGLRVLDEEIAKRSGIGLRKNRATARARSDLSFRKRIPARRTAPPAPKTSDTRPWLTGKMLPRSGKGKITRIVTNKNRAVKVS